MEKPHQTLGDHFKKLRLRINRLKDQNAAAFADAAIPKKQELPSTTIAIPLGAVAKATAIILILIFLFQKVEQISGVLLIFFVAFILAAALDPIVGYFQNYKVPRALTVLVIYAILLLISAVFGFKLVTLIGSQLSEIAHNVTLFVTRLFQGDVSIPYAKSFQAILTEIYQRFDIQSATNQLQNVLELASTQLINVSIGIINVVLILILTFFMTVEEKPIENFLLSLFNSEYAVYISSRLQAVKIHIGHWVRGQILVSFIAGIVTYIGLTIMGVEYALTLAAIAGVCMVIPIFGRVIAWVITLPIVFNQSPGLALALSIFYLILQQLEVNIMVPYIMNRAVGLSPIIIIFAMMVGSQFLGIPGLIIAIPIGSTVAIFVKDYAMKEKK